MRGGHGWNGWRTFSSLRPWDLLNRRTRKRVTHGSEQSGLPHLRCKWMPLSVQKNGEDFPWPEEPVRLLSGGDPQHARWSISAKPHAWWWWKMAWHSVSIKTVSTLPNPPTPLCKTSRSSGQIFPELPPQLLMVRRSPAVGSAFWGTNWEPRWTPPLLQFNPPPGLQAAFAWCPEPRVSDRLMNPSEFDTPSEQGDTGSELVSKIRNTGSDLCAEAWRAG